MVAIVVISGIGLLGLAAVLTGLASPLISSVQEVVAAIEWPQWLSVTPPDTTPPAVSNVDVSDVTQTSAVITWETDEPATSQIMACDPDGICTWTEQDTTLATTHSVSLTGLKPNTTYHYTVISMDAGETEVTSEGEFPTPGGADTTNPVISGVDTFAITDSSATISWKTDENATSQVEYGTTDAYGSTTPLDEKLTKNHSVALSGLQPDTTYHFMVKSRDSSGNEATSSDTAFQTQSPVPPAPAPPVAENDKPAPDFSLQTIEGEAVSLSKFRGRLVMLNFRTIESDIRAKELYSMQTVRNEWSPDELVILAVHFRDSATDVRSFVDGKGFTFRLVIDPLGEVAGPNCYDVTSIPTTFFIDREGIIRAVKKGRFDSARRIEDILESM